MNSLFNPPPVVAVIQPSKRGKRGTVPAAVQHGGGHFVSDEYTVGYHGLAHTHMASLLSKLAF